MQRSKRVHPVGFWLHRKDLPRRIVGRKHKTQVLPKKEQVVALLRMTLDEFAAKCMDFDIDFDKAYKSVVDKDEHNKLTLDTQNKYFPHKILRNVVNGSELPVTERDLTEAFLGVGPGTELKLLLSRYLGIQSTPGCSCNKKAKRMNQKGVEWCEANKETICKWLQEEAGKKKLPFVKAVAMAVVSLAIHRDKKRIAKDREQLS